MKIKSFFLFSLLFAIMAATATAATLNIKTYSFGDQPEQLRSTDWDTGYYAGVPLPNYVYGTSGPGQGLHFVPAFIAINFVIYYVACLVVFGVVRVIVKKKR